MPIPPRAAAEPGTGAGSGAAAGSGAGAGTAEKTATRRSSWWFDFTIDRDHLAMLRFAFFALLAVDAFLQLSHAPRYGAGDFNVPHFAWLPLPAPSRTAMVVIDLTMTYLFALAALGVATRLVVPLGTALFNYAYFVSQLDSYQHHYLVAMLLIIASFIPWHARTPEVRSWALRLFTVQLALLYLWAALAKLEPRWLDGSTLKLQLRPAWIRDLVGDHWALVAKAVIVGELAVAGLWLWRRGWLLALPLGVGFHVSVELAEFKIGQFSYIMIAIYTLAVPTAIAAWPARALGRLTARLPRGAPPVAIGALALGLAAGAGLLVAAPLGGGAAVLGLTAAVAVAALALDRRWAVGVAHVVGCAAILTLGHVTDQAVDHYRLWAGSANRLGKPAEVRQAAEALIALDSVSGPGRYYLGALAYDAGDLDAALSHFRLGQRGDPRSPRLHVGEARVLLAQGDRAGARAAAERALALDPKHREARSILVQTRGETPAPPPGSGAGADAEADVDGERDRE